MSVGENLESERIVYDRILPTFIVQLWVGP